MTEARRHRLDGLEPDNLLAFLALLGLLRALESVRCGWHPRAGWDVDGPPLRPVLALSEPVSREAVCEAAVEGVAALTAAIDVRGASDLKMAVSEANPICEAAASQSGIAGRYCADLCAALICDVASSPEEQRVDPTPLAYPSVATSNFLRNFLVLAGAELPEKRSRDPSFPKNSNDCIAQALFEPWQRKDRPVGLRWDPDETKRHVYQWRAPTKDPPSSQHGAKRLELIGLSVLTCAPINIGTRVRLCLLGGEGSGDRFTIAWPIWRPAISLASIRALLSHPSLRNPEALRHLGVDHVKAARRISLDRCAISAAPSRCYKLKGKQLRAGVTCTANHERNLIETHSSAGSGFPAIGTRDDKLARNVLAGVLVAAVI